MNTKSAGVSFLVLLIALLLVACAELPKSDFHDIPTSINTRKSKAVTLKEQGHLAEALLEWKILHLLRPDDNAILHELKATKAAIDHRVGAHMTAASAVANKGRSDKAYIYYLKVLALDPNNGEALHQLRAIEGKRVRVVQQRNTMALLERKKNASQRVPAKDRVDAYAQEATNQAIPEKNKHLESGLRFFEQANYASSITELNEYLGLYPNDSVAKKYLAEAHLKVANNYQQKGDLHDALSHLQKARLYHEGSKVELDRVIDQVKKQLADRYYEAGLQIYRGDVSKAIDYWKKSLSYNSNHVKAKLYLQRGIKMKKNWDEIERLEQ